MLYQASRGLALALSLGGLLTGGLVACGTSDADNRDTGSPNDPFKTGNGANDPYGYGAGVSQCPDELKACDVTITYTNHGESNVELRGDFGGQSTWTTGIPMTTDGNVWRATIQAPYGKPVLYKFFTDGIGQYDKDKPTEPDGFGGFNNKLDPQECAKPTCAEEGALPPGVYDWRDSVMYFVFVDRFKNGRTSNDINVPNVEGGYENRIANFHNGDWAGLTQKIQEGYFNELGVNTLWISVPFENPETRWQGANGDTHWYTGYHGYWPVFGNDPRSLTTARNMGTLAELKQVVSTAHENGLKVLIDFAMVHAHSDSQVYQSHRDWFWENKSPDGNRNCICGDGCSWDNDYKRCWFAEYLPHWNYGNADARNYSVTNAVEWIKQTQDAAGNGVDGFRADAIKHIDTKWLNELRTRIAAEVTPTQSPAQRFYMVGETYDFGNRDFIRSFIEPSTLLDGQFDFPLRAVLVSTTILRQGGMNDLAKFMDTNDYYYGASAVMSTFIGNHDLPRIIHLAQDNPLWNDQGADGKNLAWNNTPGPVTDAKAFERVANGFAVILTNRGAPLIYYGDEIGLPGAGDPDNRRDMQFDAWTDNQRFLHDRIAKLNDIRSKHPALRRGTRTTMSADTDTWVYKRSTSEDVVYVAVNRSDSAKTVSGIPSGSYSELVTDTTVSGDGLSVPPRQTRILFAK